MEKSKEMIDLEARISDYNKEIELDPKNAVAYNNRGTAMRELGDLGAAISDYDIAIDILLGLDDEKTQAGRLTAVTYYNRGVAKGVSGDLLGAEKDLTKSLSFGYYTQEIQRNLDLINGGPCGRPDDNPPPC